MPVTSRLSLAAKGDQSTEQLGLERRAMELDLGYRLTDKWSVSTGVRNDLREDRSPVVPLTRERTDAVAQVAFDPGTSWRAYGFVQDTVSSSGDREGKRAHRRGRLLSPDETLQARRGGIRRGPLGPAAGSAPASWFPSDQSVPELLAGKTTDRDAQRAASVGAAWSAA